MHFGVFRSKGALVSTSCIGTARDAYTFATPRIGSRGRSFKRSKCGVRFPHPFVSTLRKCYKPRSDCQKWKPLRSCTY